MEGKGGVEGRGRGRGEGKGRGGEGRGRGGQGRAGEGEWGREKATHVAGADARASLESVGPMACRHAATALSFSRMRAATVPLQCPFPHQQQQQGTSVSQSRIMADVTAKGVAMGLSAATNCIVAVALHLVMKSMRSGKNGRCSSRAEQQHLSDVRRRVRRTIAPHNARSARARGRRRHEHKL